MTTCKYTCGLTATKVSQMGDITTELNVLVERADALYVELATISDTCTAAVSCYNRNLRETKEIGVEHDKGCDMVERVANLKPLSESLMAEVRAVQQHHQQQQQSAYRKRSLSSAGIMSDSCKRARSDSSSTPYGWVKELSREESVRLYRMTRWMQECEKRGLVDFADLAVFNSDMFIDCLQRTVTLMSKVVNYTDKNMAILANLLRDAYGGKSNREQLCWKNAVCRTVRDYNL